MNIDEYPPGKPLPDWFPPPLRVLAEQAHADGATLRITRTDGGKDGGHSGVIEIIKSSAPSSCAENTCLVCQLQRSLVFISENPSLSPDEKFEAAVKLVNATADDVTEEQGGRAMKLHLRLHAMKFLATKENRLWLAEQMTGRLLDLAKQAVAVDPPNEIHTDEDADQFIEKTTNIELLTDATNMMTAFSETSPPLFIDHLEDAEGDSKQ